MTERPLQADARRNRDRLLEVAVRSFTLDGPDVPLETIAKAAGVGIGTFYRHFATREALVEAAYRSELDRLCSSVPGLVAELPPDQALRAWMGRFVNHMVTKRGMADALRVVVASGGNPYALSRDMLLAAVTSLVEAGVRAGTLRADVPPADVFAALTGITLTVGDPARCDQARRLLDLLMDGLRALIRSDRHFFFLPFLSFFLSFFDFFAMVGPPFTTSSAG
jgi:AcrR family transcriptional regulator